MSGRAFLYYKWNTETLLLRRSLSSDEAATYTFSLSLTLSLPLSSVPFPFYSELWIRHAYFRWTKSAKRTTKHIYFDLQLNNKEQNGKRERYIVKAVPIRFLSLSLPVYSCLVLNNVYLIICITFISSGIVWLFWFTLLFGLLSLSICFSLFVFFVLSFCAFSSLFLFVRFPALSFWVLSLIFSHFFLSLVYLFGKGFAAVIRSTRSGRGKSGARSNFPLLFWSYSLPLSSEETTMIWVWKGLLKWLNADRETQREGRRRRKRARETEKEKTRREERDGWGKRERGG